MLETENIFKRSLTNDDYNGKHTCFKVSTAFDGFVQCLLTGWHHSKWLALSTHWGRVTYIYVSRLTITGSDNCLSPGRRQAIIWTNAGVLLIGTLGTDFSEILGEIYSFSFKKMHLKMSSAKGRLFSLGLNELSIKTIYWIGHLGKLYHSAQRRAYSVLANRSVSWKIMF